MRGVSPELYSLSPFVTPAPAIRSPVPEVETVTHFLTALPVYNEAERAGRRVEEVHRYSPEILLVDGRLPATARAKCWIRWRISIWSATPKNRGYGRP